MKTPKLKVGDWVEVRSKEEILKSLDSSGQLDGMPFMPEMFAFCGRRFLVHKRAHKTCDTVFPVRSRRVDRALHLETRCDGQAHGGCQAGCLIFWKEAWLKPVDGDKLPAQNQLIGISGTTEASVWAHAKTTDDNGTPRYVCQATQLPYATTRLTWWDIRQYVEDYTSGNVSLWRISCGFVYSMYYNLSQVGIGVGPAMRWFYDKFHPLWRGTLFPRHRGTIPPGQATPTATLNLEVGELVRVKSHEEILKTITTESKNRGMIWDAELVPFCGKTYRVLNRVTRLINEKTGEMQEMKNPCIILDAVVCEGRYSNCRMFCPRSIYPYWREIWLERELCRLLLPPRQLTIGTPSARLQFSADPAAPAKGSNNNASLIPTLMTPKRRLIRAVSLVAVLVGIAVLLLGRGILPPRSVSFSQPTRNPETFDFIEISARVSAPHASNPFTGADIRGTFVETAGNKHWQVEGFCDADDGSVYRIRFMPPAPGDYTYSVEYSQGWSRRTSTGGFHVGHGSRRGPIRIDPQNRWHFIWEGTGEHYFFNGTTAYWLIGWRDDEVIRSSIERLHRLKVNRIRVTIAGREGWYFGEPVMPGNNWTPYLTPWPVGSGARFLHLLGRAGQRFGVGLGRDVFDSLAGLGQTDDIYHPGFDYSRFQVSYWQKFERALRFARDRDVIFSLVLDMNDSRVHPAAGSADERRFIRYAIARFGAFSNVTWDLGDDLDHYRDDKWTHTTGALIKQWDPYQHLATSHPIDNVHQDRTSEWFDFTSFQEWSRTQHAFMLAQRREQQRLGRIIPQTNEEYGYEDHYPLWAKGPGSESADTLRRTAWEIVMAGGYQTAGETARRGTNIWPDSGGGWMNGRGDNTMTMFEGYAHMVDFFTSFDWWKTEPHDELVNNGNYCLAKIGELYAVYLPRGGSVTIQLQPAHYDATWWNAVTGEKTALPSLKVTTSSWTLPAVTGSTDWALLLQKKDRL